MSTPSVLAASSLVDPGSPTSIAVFVLVSIAVLSAVATILIRTRRRQHRDGDRPGDDHHGPGPDTGGG